MQGWISIKLRKIVPDKSVRADWPVRRTHLFIRTLLLTLRPRIVVTHTHFKILNSSSFSCIDVSKFSQITTPENGWNRHHIIHDFPSYGDCKSHKFKALSSNVVHQYPCSQASFTFPLICPCLPADSLSIWGAFTFNKPIMYLFGRLASVLIYIHWRVQEEH